MASNSQNANQSTAKKWICNILWLIAFAAAVWIYLYPVDNFVPEYRSDRRPTPVALSQADRAEEIEAEVNRLFDRLEELRGTKEGFNLGNFNSPASTEEIAKLEQRFGPLPLDFKAYLKRHNGFKDYGAFYGYQPLLKVDSMMAQTEDLLAIGENNGVTPMCHEGCWFHPGSVIFEESDGGGYVINVTNGHIYSWDHDGGPFQLKFESFTEMLKKIVRFSESDSTESSARWWEEE